MKTIALISCVAKKRQKPSAAQDLYTSVWFMKARTYLEQEEIPWYILSAKYGLLNRDQIIEPYEQTLNTMLAKKRKIWSDHVFQQICTVMPEPGKIRFFAGQRYRQYLIPQLEQANYQIEVPLKHLGIGRQLAWFMHQTKRDIDCYIPQS